MVHGRKGSARLACKKARVRTTTRPLSPDSGEAVIDSTPLRPTQNGTCVCQLPMCQQCSCRLSKKKQGAMEPGGKLLLAPTMTPGPFPTAPYQPVWAWAPANPLHLYPAGVDRNPSVFPCAVAQIHSSTHTIVGYKIWRINQRELTAVFILLIVGPEPVIFVLSHRHGYVIMLLRKIVTNKMQNHSVSHNLVHLPTPSPSQQASERGIPGVRLPYYRLGVEPFQHVFSKQQALASVLKPGKDHSIPRVGDAHVHKHTHTHTQLKRDEQA